MINQKESSHIKIRSYYQRWKSNFDTFSNEITKKLKNEIEAVLIIPNDLSFIKNIEKQNISKLITFVVITKNIASTENIQKQINKREKVINDAIKRNNIKIQYSIYHLEELWNKFNDHPDSFSYSISNCFPIYSEKVIDSLILAIKLKERILEKFERYALAICFSGSVARLSFTEKSDFDLFIVIDDTDVKKMTKNELRDKMISIFRGNIDELAEKLKISSNLNFQTYLLTDFWLNLRNNNPVIHTLLRDGIPIFDKGIFIAWKKMLKNGDLVPTSNACELFVYDSERILTNFIRKIGVLITEDLFLILIQYAQSILMINRIAPTTPQETLSVLSNENVNYKFNLKEESILYISELINLRKEYEHGTIKEFSVNILLDQYDKAIAAKLDLEKVFKTQKRRNIESSLESALLKIDKTVNSIKENFMDKLNIDDSEFGKILVDFIYGYQLGENSLKMIIEHFGNKMRNDDELSMDYFERTIVYMENKLNSIDQFFREVLMHNNLNIEKEEDDYILKIADKHMKINFSKIIVHNSMK
jgi:predicted nucleotidyltransferase